MENFSQIVTVASGIVTLVGLLGLFTNKGREIFQKLSRVRQINEEQNKAISDLIETVNSLKSEVGSISSQMHPIKEVLKQQCRNTIKNIYYKYCDEKKIPLYEKKTVESTYKIYTEELQGNSFITILKTEIDKWEIEPPTHMDIEE